MIEKYAGTAIALPQNPIEFLKSNTVMACMEKYRGISTAIDAYKAQTASLATMGKTYGRQYTIDYIAIWIVNLNEYMNILRHMNEEQIIETAWLILDQYYNLTVADIALVFKKAKTGELGTLYESLDGLKILTWFERYASERAECVYNENTREHYKTKHPEDKRSSDTTDIRTAMHRAKGFETILRSQKH